MLARWFRSPWMLLIATALVAAPQPAAASLRPEAIAIRAGTEAFTIPEGFDFQALQVRYRLPWGSDWGGWRVATHLDFGLGHIKAEGKDAGLFTTGASVTLARGSTLLDFGTGPSVLTRDHLNGREFGGWFQFTSHAGIYYQVNRRWRIGYRIQHTSNGRIYHVNDGLDLQTVDLWVGF